MSKKTEIVLGLIFLFSFLLFSLYSTYVFPTPNWDEVSFGYNAFSILKTGRDEWGRAMPLIFRAFGDYKLPVYAYLSTIPIAILGLNVFAVRFISILAGSFLSIIIYLISRQLKLSTKVSLTIALISVINPWHLWLSSSALESNLALTLFAGGVLFSIKFIKSSRQHKFFILATIFLGLAMHTYNSYRLIAPLIFVLLIFDVIKINDPGSLKRTFLPVVIFSFFLLPIIYQTYKGYGKARFDTVSLFKNPGIRLSVEADRNFPHSKLTARTFHNYPVYTLEKLTFNYLKNYSPEFLFLRGGHNLAFSPLDYGYFYWWEIILWLAGLIILIKARPKTKSALFLLISIFLISSLPAIVTVDGAHSLRSYSLLIPSLIFIALALDKIKIRPVIFGILTAYLISFFFFNEYALNHYPRHFDSHWLSAENQAVKYVVANQAKYQLIAIPKDSVDEGYIFYLFYSRLKPQKFWQLAQRRFDHNWYWVDRIGKISFPDNTNAGSYEQNPRALLITKRPIYVKHKTLVTFTSQDKKTVIKAIVFPHE